MNKNMKKILLIDEQTLSLINDILSCESCDYNELLLRFNKQDNGSIFNKCITYDDGYYMEINIFTGAESASMYIILYDDNGEEVGISAGENFSLSGIYEINEYKLIIGKDVSA